MARRREGQAADFQEETMATPPGSRVRWISEAAREGGDIMKMAKFVTEASKVEGGKERCSPDISFAEMCLEGFWVSLEFCRVRL